MTTIFKIIGGGQRVRENLLYGLPTYYERIENSDWVEKARFNGRDSYANDMWSEDLEDLQRWSNEWAGKEVTLHLKK